jgi:hypothetical protein
VGPVGGKSKQRACRTHPHDVDRFGGERVKVEDTKQVNPTTLANNTTASSDPRHYPVPATSSRNQTFLVAARASEVVSLRFTHSIRQSHRTRDSEAARVRISSRTRLAVEQPSARAIDRGSHEPGATYGRRLRARVASSQRLVTSCRLTCLAWPGIGSSSPLRDGRDTAGGGPPAVSRHERMHARRARWVLSRGPVRWKT